MFKVPIIYGKTFGYLQAWVDSLPERFRAIRVKDRMESVLRGEEVEEIPRTHQQSTKYSYQLQITDKHEYLYDYLQFLQASGIKYAPQLRWLLVGEIVPQSYRFKTWRDDIQPLDGSTSSYVPQQDTRPVHRPSVEEAKPIVSQPEQTIVNESPAMVNERQNEPKHVAPATEVKRSESVNDGKPQTVSNETTDKTNQTVLNKQNAGQRPKPNPMIQRRNRTQASKYSDR